MEIAIILFQLVFWGVGFLLLIYLVARRIDIKRHENFENRDN